MNVIGMLARKESYGSYGYLAQNTAHVSRHALASGSCDDRKQPWVAPSG